MRVAAACAVAAAWGSAAPAGPSKHIPNPDFPPTVVRLGWLRAEHQHPERPSPRPKPKHDKPIRNNFDSLRLAIEDLAATFPKRYPHGGEYLRRLEALRKAVLETDRPLDPLAEAFDALFQEALLANPLLDFDSLLFIERARGALTPRNWLSLASIRPLGHDNAVKVLSPVRPGGKVTTLLRPPGKACVARMDLHFDARRLLFSSAGANRRWQICEMDIPPRTDANTGGPLIREIETIPDDDVDNYDACYGPDGSIYFTSTATQLGVPCIRGSSPVSNLYRRRPDGRVERLTVDQDHNWHPSMLPDGRVMYLRWEYTDLPHAFNRVIFTMNPDGTGQAAMYGSNSYWPNSTFYPRAVPGSTTMFVGVVTGHHDHGQIGQLILFDTRRGRHEGEGVVQQIPGWDKPVRPIIRDAITGGRLPMFVTPWPLSEKYFLAAARTERDAETSIYLVDVFDNALKLYGAPGRWMIEPIPLRKRPRPPVLVERTVPGATTAVVTMSDIYQGVGLRGVPRGAVRALRVYSYNYSFRRMGGQVDRVGLDGPWDVRVILGTVPVEPDGSASFVVPARMPIAVQPLDEEGKALQYMRSWFTCQPGEVRSCVGCHEDTSDAPALQPGQAALRAPSKITPWRGPVRGFSFNREVQPVLDEFCVGCHNAGTDRLGRDGRKIADLTLRPDVAVVRKDGGTDPAAHFPPAYIELKRFVRNATMESDLHVLTPWDFHADQTRLVQILTKGHHGVRLDAEAWDRLVTWMDLNTPAHGSWREIAGADRVEALHARRRDLMRRYGGTAFDAEDTALCSTGEGHIRPVLPAAEPKRPPCLHGSHPPRVDAADLAAATDPSTGRLREMTVELGGGVSLRLVRIPPGRFVLGDAAGYPDEWPERVVRVERAFWMGAFEVTNEQYARFDPAHDSRIEHGEFLHFYDGVERGPALNGPRQPVVRVSRLEAEAFCRWLSGRTGRHFALPTEQQWEWAAYFGGCDARGLVGRDFSKRANLADFSYYSVKGSRMKAVPYFLPAVKDVDDGFRVSAPVGRFAPDRAGLYDMLGNVAEWTASPWRPADPADRRVVVRGGSWRDVPYRARPSSRVPYRPEMKVVDVGFRVVVSDAR